MTFKEYQEFVKAHAIYSGAGTVLGFEKYSLPATLEELGELASLCAKGWRDNGDSFFSNPEKFKKELGDIGFQFTLMVSDLGFDLEEILEMNRDKIKDRAERGVIKGSGDDR